MLAFPSAPTKKKQKKNTCDTRHKASTSKQKSTVFLRGRTQLSDFFKILSARFGAWRHSHPLVNLSIWDFYFDICERHILPARASTLVLKFAPN